MTNKELQEELKMYPDHFEIFLECGFSIDKAIEVDVERIEKKDCLLIRDH